MNRLLKNVTTSIVMAGAMAGALTAGTAAYANQETSAPPTSVRRVIELPLVPGWYNGQQVAYIQTEASDPGVAAQQQVNFVPALANVLDAPNPAVDDIYVITNFTQSNIIPSAPNPAGPGNTDPNYSPLWQVSTVTWADPKAAHTLHSEAEVKAALAALLVSVNKTHIVVNCPVIYSPQGGTLPNAKLETEGTRR
jgi:hypothetical protein